MQGKEVQGRTMQDILEYVKEYVKRPAVVAKMVKIAKIAGGVLVGILVVILIVELVEWAKVARENRQWIAVNNLTPDRLAARCGLPLEDKTQDLSLIVRREISYKARGKTTVVLAFTRTADEPNNWVFLSMRDSQGVLNYETPTSKIAALPCLDSRK